MRMFRTLTIVAVSLLAGAVQAQTAIQPGLWESNDKTTMEGMQPIPGTSKQVCLKANEAQLERLLFPAPEEMAIF